ncbi:MAG: hypothetical protein M3348_16440 [Acidobacteriota bacterium]|nr:hypothetical protein [Acidobacteriota bacterium]
MWRKEVGLTICGLVMACSACGRSNNLLLGRVEATVGGHTVVVTDCYRTSVPPPEKVGGPGEQSYRFMPCRDADVLVRNDELIVNGSSYGLLRRADAVTVDHGKVLINEVAVPAVARR